MRVHEPSPRRDIGRCACRAGVGMVVAYRLLDSPTPMYLWGGSTKLVCALRRSLPRATEAQRAHPRRASCRRGE